MSWHHARHGAPGVGGLLLEPEVRPRRRSGWHELLAAPTGTVRKQTDGYQPRPIRLAFNLLPPPSQSGQGRDAQVKMCKMSPTGAGGPHPGFEVPILLTLLATFLASPARPDPSDPKSLRLPLRWLPVARARSAAWICRSAPPLEVMDAAVRSPPRSCRMQTVFPHAPKLAGAMLRAARTSWQPGVSGLRVLEGFPKVSAEDRWRVRPRQAVGAAMGASLALAAGVAAAN